MEEVKHEEEEWNWREERWKKGKRNQDMDAVLRMNIKFIKISEYWE